MIKTNNIKQVLEQLNFTKKGQVYSKKFKNFDCELKADFKNNKLVYPKALKVNEKHTLNITERNNENLVVFECVHRLLSQGYNPEHIVLEKRAKDAKGDHRFDISIKDNSGRLLLVIECKTQGKEYQKAFKDLHTSDTNQLFRYLNQDSSIEHLVLYTSDFVDEKLKCEYVLINVKDNEELLKNDPKLKGYKDATNNQERWQVWCDTYDKEYASIGLFENNKPYEIGKNKFSIRDLQSVDNQDIQKIHHSFASVLRKYGIDEKENAFNSLLNLFLCKATDENINPKELQCYWKGKAYDNPFDFQDRLQKLYQIGMKKFLNEDITYITREQIEKRFHIFKDDPSIIKDHILEDFKQIKFFSNSAFSFIDVHNERLFYKNFQILLDVFKIIQNISLTSSEENQLLGDLFEIFLDGGVQQNEGMFFTPMPIVKFIINSLPQKENPRVIDYACGAGHFLNEYAQQNKNCDEVIGIDKSHRLAKISKVSSYMYGNDIDVITDDALGNNPKIKDNYFDVLIANPPYSVKGFLETLSEEEKQKFELTNYVNNIATGKYIECFFIEKAKRILRKDALVGIVLPSSILNKTEKVFTKTREIILQHFYIYAIAQLPSETFGKTGTNTITLFLKRRDPSEELEVHYKNMAKLWLNNKFDTNDFHTDRNFFEDYCRFMNFDLDDYKAFLGGKITDAFVKNELITEYKKEFNKKFEKSYKEPRSKDFKEKTKAEKQAYKQQQRQSEFLAYLKEKETEKLYYFCLAKSQKNDVIIISSPDKKDKAKKFLGYDWSNRKGNEGIQYFSNVSIDLSIDKEELDTEEQRALENQYGLKYINTPLYNPDNTDDETKINKVIKDHFNGVKAEVNDAIKDFVSRSTLVDILDFDKVDFGKTFNLRPKKKIEIESKYPLKRLGDFKDISFLNGYAFKSENFKDDKTNKDDIEVLKIKNILQDNFTDFANCQYHSVKNQEDRIIEVDDLVIALTGATVGKSGWVTKKSLLNQRVLGIKGNQFTLKYISLFIFGELFYEYAQETSKGNAQGNLSPDEVKDFKIPILPKDIQQKIVSEIEVLEKEEHKTVTEIESLKEETNKLLSELYDKSTNEIRLSDDDFNIGIGKRVLKKEISEQGKYPIYSANVYKPFGFTDKELLTDFSKTSVIWGIDGDWMVNVIPANTPFYPTDHCGYLQIKKPIIEPLYLAYCLEIAGKEKRFSRTIRASINRISDIKIPFPPIKEQKKIVSKIKKIEQKIKTLENTITNIPEQKKAILKKYL